VAAETPELGETLEVTVDAGTANLVRLIEIPERARWVRIRPRAAVAKLLRQTADGEIVLADGAALGTVDYETLTADATITIPVPGVADGGRGLNKVAALRRIWVASATTSTVIEITPLP
jgi:hypothetical protein